MRKAWIDSPELNVMAFGLLLHFAWEMLQMPLFLGSPEVRYSQVLTKCLLATFGDAGIVLVAFWGVTMRAQSGRGWLLAPTTRQVVGFTAIGVLITIIFEIAATKVWNRWS
jgi:hypothetical protein